MTHLKRNEHYEEGLDNRDRRGINLYNSFRPTMTFASPIIITPFFFFSPIKFPPDPILDWWRSILSSPATAFGVVWSHRNWYPKCIHGSGEKRSTVATPTLCCFRIKELTKSRNLANDWPGWGWGPFRWFKPYDYLDGSSKVIMMSTAQAPQSTCNRKNDDVRPTWPDTSEPFVRSIYLDPTLLSSMTDPVQNIRSRNAQESLGEELILPPFLGWQVV